MTKYRRIIPVLLLSEGYLVKPIKFGKSQYIGDPINAVKIFNDMQADEIILLDMDPSRKGSSINFQLIEEIATEAFMPVAYGGGISDKKHGIEISRLGIEKVVLGTSAVSNQSLITDLSSEMGSQGVVACLDYKMALGGQRVYIEGGRKKTTFSPEELSKIAVSMGAGEILLQNISREGSRNGYDYETLAKIRKLVDVPISILGGAGNLNHIKLAFEEGASAACAGTLFVTQGTHKAVLINYPDPSTADVLRGFL